MEIKGKVTHILEPVTGTSAKGDWKKQTFVILEDKEQYPKSIAIDAFNKDLEFKVGDVINVSINIESREYQGKWYTNVGMWKSEMIEVGKADGHKTPPPESKTEEVVPEPTNDLPF